MEAEAAVAVRPVARPAGAVEAAVDRTARVPAEAGSRTGAA